MEVSFSFTKSSLIAEPTTLRSHLIQFFSNKNNMIENIVKIAKSLNIQFRKILIFLKVS